MLCVNLKCGRKDRWEGEDHWQKELYIQTTIRQHVNRFRYACEELNEQKRVTGHIRKDKKLGRRDLKKDRYISDDMCGGYSYWG